MHPLQFRCKMQRKCNGRVTVLLQIATAFQRIDLIFDAECDGLTSHMLWVCCICIPQPGWQAPDVDMEPLPHIVLHHIVLHHIVLHHIVLQHASTALY